MTNLSKLIRRVEAATAGDREIDRLMALAASGATEDRSETGELRGYYKGGSWVSIGPIEPVTTSLDAALSLVERCLPGWRVAFNSDDDRGPEWAASIKPHGEKWPAFEFAPTPALALLLAMLKALEAQ